MGHENSALYWKVKFTCLIGITQNLESYIDKNATNAGFQVVHGLWFIGVDFRLYTGNNSKMLNHAILEVNSLVHYAKLCVYPINKSISVSPVWHVLPSCWNHSSFISMPYNWWTKESVITAIFRSSLAIFAGTMFVNIWTNIAF